jgi:hypothetical protein
MEVVRVVAGMLRAAGQVFSGLQDRIDEDCWTEC